MQLPPPSSPEKFRPIALKATPHACPHLSPAAADQLCLCGFASFRGSTQVAGAGDGAARAAPGGHWVAAKIAPGAAEVAACPLVGQAWGPALRWQRESRHPSHPPQCPLVAPPTSRSGLGLGRDPGAIPRGVLGTRGRWGTRPGKRGPTPEAQRTAAPGDQGWTHSRSFAPGPRPSPQAAGVGDVGAPT